MPDPLTGENVTLFEFLEDPDNVIVARLAKNPIATDGGTIALGDLQEADFPGYEPITIDFWDAIDIGDDAQGMAVYDAFWEADGIVEPQSVYCVYLTYKHATDPEILWWPIVLPTPITFAVDGDEFPFTIQLRAVDESTVPPTAIDV